MKTYKVGVFPKRPGERAAGAYLRDYNPQWEGCVEVTVSANSGAEAKRMAIMQVEATRKAE